MFMNRVHTVTQKHYRVKNPGQKPNWLHEPPTGPASAPGAPRLARSWSCRGRPGRVVAEPPGPVAAQGCHVAAQPARPYTPAHSLVPPAAARPRAPAPRAPAPVPPSVCLPFLPHAPRPAARSACLRAHCAPRLRTQLHALHARAPTHACLHAPRATCACPAPAHRPSVPSSLTL